MIYHTLCLVTDFPAFEAANFERDMDITVFPFERKKKWDNLAHTHMLIFKRLCACFYVATRNSVAKLFSLQGRYITKTSHRRRLEPKHLTRQETKFSGSILAYETTR